MVGPEDGRILAEVMYWLRSYLAQPHPDLGRKGSVCPFMEQSLKLGRTAISSVDVSGPQGELRLETLVRSVLGRLGTSETADDLYNAFVLVPVGADADTRHQIVVKAQQALKKEAILSGRGVGEFLPGHPMPGIHSETFRPLVSPQPVLAVRSMVVTDILFLSFPEIPAEDRLCYLEVWHGLFGVTAAERWDTLYRKAKKRAEKEIGERT